MTHNRDSEQRSRLQSKRTLQSLKRYPGVDLFTFGVVEVCEIDHRNRQASWRVNNLHHFSVHQGKRRAEILMPAADLVETLFQRGEVHRTLQSHSEIDVKSRRAVRKFVLEPKTLLGK